MKQLSILLVLVSLVGCRTKERIENSKINLNKDKELIVQMLTDRYNKFQNASDPLEQAKIYVENLTEDAIWMYQNGAQIKGKANVRKWDEWFFSNYSLVVEKTFFDEPLIGSNIAVRRFISVGYYIVKATGDSLRFNQKYEDVFHKVNGEWKIASHMWNSNNIDQSIWNLDSTEYVF